MQTPQLMLTQINAFEQNQFVSALSSLFEGPPWIVTASWQLRPFPSRARLYRALCDVMYLAPIERKIALLQAHPDLVGRAALAGTLTPASASEQAVAGLNRLTPEEIEDFSRLNTAYWERFGFPFVICARENKKASILAGFASRLQHTRDEEIALALAEVAKICLFRLNDLVQPDEPSAGEGFVSDKE